MRPTIATAIKTQQPTEVSTWLADIISIDYNAKQMVINIRGASGPRRVNIGALNVGTSASPLMFAGNQVIVQRLNDQYFALQYIPAAGMSSGTIAGRTILPAPTGFSIKQVGTNLEASWNPVAGANFYEIYSNTSATPDGASLVGATSGTMATWTSNMTGELLANRGFESGDFVNWKIAGIPSGTVGVTIDNTTVHTATYSAKTIVGNILSYVNLPTQNYGVIQSTIYQVRTYYDITALTGNATLFLYYDYYKSDLTTNGGTSETMAIAVTSGWTLFSTTVTPPTNTAYLALRFRASTAVTAGSAITVYIDDVSFIGQTSIQNNLLYAVRAMSNQGDSSPFTSWLQPAVQQAMTAGFISNVAGVRFGSDGIDGLLVPPGDRLAKYYFLR